MKTLQILRHAKTERLQLGQQDKDRKLTERGLNQLADLLANQQDNLSQAQHVLVSTAKRTRMTLKQIEQLFSKESIQFDDNLYLASLVTLAQTIEQQDDQLNNLLLIGHNDGLSDFVSFLVGEHHYLPTSGYVVLELEIERWQHLSKGIGRIRESYFSEAR